MSATIYMETYGLSLRKSGNCFKISGEDDKKQEIPAFSIGSVVVSADGVSISGGAVRLCQENDIPIFFLPVNGGQTSVLAPVECRSPELQAAQIRAQEESARIHALAQGFVQGKIGNQLNLAKYFKNSRGLKTGEYADSLGEYADTVADILSGSGMEPDTDDISLMRNRLFSAEGRAASAYWHMVSLLIPQDMEFPGRTRKGAKDAVNCMLNYGYAILATRVHQALLHAGFSTYFSFLHSPRPGRASLIYDLMEEFRPWAVDRVVIGMCGKGRKVKTDGNGKLKTEDRRFLIQSLEKRWAADNLRKLLANQAEVLSRAVMEKKPYVPVKFLSSGAVQAGTAQSS
ncbi:MAG: CRISPR-associated endonuclease Cas1 [Desulfobacterales bacterium]